MPPASGKKNVATNTMAVPRNSRTCSSLCTRRRIKHGKVYCSIGSSRSCYYRSRGRFAGRSGCNQIRNGYIMVDHYGTFATMEDLDLADGESLYIREDEDNIKEDEFDYSFG